MQEEIDKAMEEQFNLSDRTMMMLLAEYNFKSEQEAKDNGYEMLHELDTNTGIREVKLCKVVARKIVPKVILTKSK